MNPGLDRASAIAAYKSVLEGVVDRRPSGTRHRLDLALRKDRSFATSPVCPEPIPPADLETIFQVCDFTPREKSEFLAAYTQANALEPFEDGDLRATIEHMHEVELELVRSEERYRALYHEWELTFESMETPILLLDPGGRIVRLNRAACELLSCGPRGLVGRSLKGTAPGEPWRKASELAAEVSNTRTPARGHVGDDASGRTWHITADLSPGLAGGEERFIVVVRDVTQMVTLQESLRRSERLSAMGSLVAGVAHEVRNPLFAISASLDVLEANLGGRTDSAEMIAVLRREASRLSALMQDLLDYGRPAIKKRVPDSLEEALGDAIAACQELAGKNRVELVNRVHGLPPVVMDRGRIVQVFQNLIANAVQHSAPGAQVVIEAQATSLNGRPGVACSVVDSGPGLPGGDLRRVFEPFFTRRRGGTGLGLSIAQRIVEDHEGLIAAANRPLGGALFTVQLPSGV